MGFGRKRKVVPFRTAGELDAMAAEAEEVAARERLARERGRPVALPCALISGGETTVTIEGEGVSRPDGSGSDSFPRPISIAQAPGPAATKYRKTKQ
mgnify:CR=1 FL=1